MVHIRNESWVSMKKYLSIFLALMLLLSLCACATPDIPDTSTSESTGDPSPSTEGTQLIEPSTAPTDTMPSDPTVSTEPSQCSHEQSRHEITATCTEPGQIRYDCLLCGDIAIEEIPALGHKYQDATCTQAKTCSVCGSVEGTALGHSYTDGKCTRCGAKMPNDDIMPPGCEHEWHITQTAPTCTSAGTIHYTCTKCNCPYTETIPATGHKFADATCNLPQTCTICTATQGNALGHSYTDGTCIRCGTKDPSLPVTIQYRVTVRSDKGQPIGGITVYVYTTGSNPAASGKTGSNGTVILELEPHTEYKIILSDVPEKFQAKESYTFRSSIVNINLTTIPVISPTDHSKANYKVGSTMGDFTVTDTNGISYTLSELLKEKELIILDFWFVNCGPCKSEFPYFESIFKKYADDVQLLTFDPFDSEAAIKTLRDDMGVTFPMIRDTIKLHEGFGVAAYPTTVFIDHTGKILKIETGAFKSEQELIEIIERYL